MPDGTTVAIHVALGAPYRPAMLDGNYAGCQVLTCDDPDLSSEVIGRDEMDALAVALEFLELYLIKIVEETHGRLSELDGTPIDPRGSGILLHARKFVANKRQAE